MALVVVLFVTEMSKTGAGKSADVFLAV